MRKVIISLAPVQAGTSVDAVKLAEDVEKSVKLGAAMCHLTAVNQTEALHLTFLICLSVLMRF